MIILLNIEHEPENAYRNYRIIIACFILNFIQVTA